MSTAPGGFQRESQRAWQPPGCHCLHGRARDCQRSQRGLGLGEAPEAGSAAREGKLQSSARAADKTLCLPLAEGPHPAFTTPGKSLRESQRVRQSPAAVARPAGQGIAGDLGEDWGWVELQRQAPWPRGEAPEFRQSSRQNSLSAISGGATPSIHNTGRVPERTISGRAAADQLPLKSGSPAIPQSGQRAPQVLGELDWGWVEFQRPSSVA